MFRRIDKMDINPKDELTIKLSHGGEQRVIVIDVVDKVDILLEGDGPWEMWWTGTEWVMSDGEETCATVVEVVNHTQGVVGLPRT